MGVSKKLFDGLEVCISSEPLAKCSASIDSMVQKIGSDHDYNINEQDREQAGCRWAL